MSMIPSRSRGVSAFGQQQIAPLTQPESSLGQTLDAFVNETYYGVGSYNADEVGFDVYEAKLSGTPIDEEQFKSIAGNSGAKYEAGMTAEAAKLLVDYQNDRNLNSSVIINADGWKKAAGYATAFTVGVVEPKNVAYGVAGAALTGPVAALLPVGRSLSRISQLRRVAAMNGQRLARTAEEYKALAAAGAIDGFVGAALMEPSNRDTANTLQQDYTMADSLWNVGTSLAFGVGARTLPPFIADKWNKYKAKTPDVVALEVDTAVEQMATGRKVDVTPVEKIVDGEISAKPIAEKAATIEQFVRYTETPEFKARFNDSVSPDVKSEGGTPKQFFHGTSNTEFTKFNTNPEPRGVSAPQQVLGAFFTENPQRASGFAYDYQNVSPDGGNVRVVYLSPQKLYTLTRQEQADINSIGDRDLQIDEFMKLRKKLEKQGFDGVKLESLGGEGESIAIFSPEQIISAYGADDLDAITARLDAENKAIITKSIEDDINPRNDTAIDFEAAQAIETVEAQLEAASTTTYDDAIKAHIDELESMREQGMITNEEFGALGDMVNQLDDANMEQVMKAAYMCLTGV